AGRGATSGRQAPRHRRNDPRPDRRPAALPDDLQTRVVTRARASHQRPPWRPRIPNRPKHGTAARGPIGHTQRDTSGRIAATISARSVRFGASAWLITALATRL